jgi:signal transduction histidine kinase
MDFSALFCSESWNPQWLVFTDQAPTLLYYSHIPTSLIALFLAVFVYFKNRTLASGFLLMISILFTTWNFIDLVIWTNADSRLILLLWSTLYLLQALILACAWYFSQVFLDGKDVVLRQKLFMGAALLPLIVLMPTAWNLPGFDLVNCEAQQGILVNYFYSFQGITLLWIFGHLVGKYRGATNGEEKKKIAIFSLGIFLFLVSFSWGNVFGSLTLKWELEQYGLFGMPVFIGFLAFLIVRYRAFNIKLIGAQALVVTQIVLIGSMLFFAKSTTNQILTVLTLMITAGVGWLVIKSVKEEMRRKEELQKISNTLAIANERLKELDLTKSEFISIASHQLRTPLTAIKGYISLLLEGSYGKIPLPIQDILNKIYTVNNRLVHLVEDLLNISRIEAGRIQYTFIPTQLEPLVAELVDMFMPAAKEKGLTLQMQLSKNPLPRLTIDPNKIKEVVSNLIDNALKYTKTGGAVVTVERAERVARIIVSDTGIGIRPEDMKNLFEKFLRSKETTKMVVSGVGLGLYVGKSFVVAHGGRIWAESDGADKGSRFIVELPLVNPKIHTGTSDQPSPS